MARMVGAINGLKVIFHCWVVLLHVVYYRAFFVSVDSKLYKELSRNPIAQAITFGGVQVDVFFIIAGFLLANHILALQTKEEIKSFAKTLPIRRFIRFQVMLVIVIALFYLTSSNWLFPKSDLFLVEMLTMQSPYSYQLEDGFQQSVLSPNWSTQVDFYMQIVLGGVMCALCVFFNKPLGEIKFVGVFTLLALSLGSVYRRHWLFVNENLSYADFLVGNHYMLIPQIESGVLREKFDVTQFYGSVNGVESLDSQRKAHQVFTRVYSGVFERIPTMAFGCVVALVSNEEVTIPRALVYLTRVICCAVLCLSLLPVDAEKMNDFEKWFATVFSHCFFGIPLAFFIYSAVATEKSSFYSPTMNKALSWKWFQILAEATYGSLLLHSMIIAFVSFGPLKPLVGYDVVEKLFGVQEAFRVFVMDCFKVFFVTATCSFSLGLLLTRLLEKPILTFVHGNVFGEVKNKKKKL